MFKFAEELSQEKWDRRFIELARLIASWSKDRSTKVGAVVMSPDRKPRSFGYNGFPRGIDDEVEYRHQRPAKYLWTVHAEENAVIQAPTSLEGCTIYVTHHPCAKCARAVVQAGITTVVVGDRDDFGGRFEEEFKVAGQMFEEAGVTLRFVEQESVV